MEYKDVSKIYTALNIPLYAWYAISYPPPPMSNWDSTEILTPYNLLSLVSQAFHVNTLGLYTTSIHSKTNTNQPTTKKKKKTLYIYLLSY